MMVIKKKRKYLKTFSLVAVLLFVTGCTKTPEEKIEDYTSADFKTMFERDPREALGNVNKKMNSIDSVHMDITHGEIGKDEVTQTETMDVQKEGEAFVYLKVETESYTVGPECDESQMPDFGVAKGWSVDEFCTSMYGENYRSEPEVVTKKDYTYVDAKDVWYSSEDGKSYRRSLYGGGQAFDFEQYHSSTNSSISDCKVVENKDGSLTVTIRYTGDLYDNEVVLSKDGFLSSWKRGKDTCFVDLESVDCWTKEEYSKYNEANFEIPVSNNKEQ